MSCDQALDKLSGTLNSRLLVQEGHGFQKGAHCAPWPQEIKKKPGLDRETNVSNHRVAYLDCQLEIEKGKLVMSLYDKRDDFPLQGTKLSPSG